MCTLSTSPRILPVNMPVRVSQMALTLLAERREPSGEYPSK